MVNNANSSPDSIFADSLGLGKIIYNQISGYSSIEPDAALLRQDAVFKYASATKLITTIALLQCVDKGLVSLDRPIDHIVPELGRQVIRGISATGALLIEPATIPITPRHLLTHTSGLAYWFLHPLLMKWKKSPEGSKFADSPRVEERCNNPLVFEPGRGWAYGVGLDWAGVIVKRLHNNISLEDYMIENIWKKVGLSAPFPTFCISDHPDYQQRLMSGAERGSDGFLHCYDFWQGNNPIDQDGGHGLSGTAADWLAVLSDIISDEPKLLSKDLIDQMFQPQIESTSAAMPMLLQMRPAWELVAGAVPDHAINHGLGGVIATEDLADIKQPKGILTWGGAANTVWFASKEHGVAGFFSTQLHPFSDPDVKHLVNAWKRDFWAKFQS
jgi:CubicO group peptidase (beta-lactamase class C family)